VNTAIGSYLPQPGELGAFFEPLGAAEFLVRTTQRFFELWPRQPGPNAASDRLVQQFVERIRSASC